MEIDPKLDEILDRRSAVIEQLLRPKQDQGKDRSCAV